jgi:hypothetical protein
MAWQVPMHRVSWLTSGDSIRVVTAVRPPRFDNPTAIGIYDNKSEAFFSVDCFGAIIPSPAQGKTEQLLKLLARVPASAPFVAPNQPALEQGLAQMRGGS